MQTLFHDDWKIGHSLLIKGTRKKLYAVVQNFLSIVCEIRTTNGSFHRTYTPQYGKGETQVPTVRISSFVMCDEDSLTQPSFNFTRPLYTKTMKDNEYFRQNLIVSVGNTSPRRYVRNFAHFSREIDKYIRVGLLAGFYSAEMNVKLYTSCTRYSTICSLNSSH